MALLETNTKYQQCECQIYICNIISLKTHLLAVFSINAQSIRHWHNNKIKQHKSTQLRNVSVHIAENLYYILGYK